MTTKKVPEEEMPMTETTTLEYQAARLRAICESLETPLSEIQGAAQIISAVSVPRADAFVGRDRSDGEGWVYSELEAVIGYLDGVAKYLDSMGLHMQSQVNSDYERPTIG